MKKILILLGASIMALTLTACDGDKTTTKAENATTSENSTTGGNGTSTGGENGTTNSTTTPSTTEPTTPPATAPFSITINDIKDFYGQSIRPMERVHKIHLLDEKKQIKQTELFTAFYFKNKKIVFNNLTPGKSYGLCVQPLDDLQETIEADILGYNHLFSNKENKCIYYYDKLINTDTVLTIKLPKEFNIILKGIPNDYIDDYGINLELIALLDKPSQNGKLYVSIGNGFYSKNIHQKASTSPNKKVAVCISKLVNRDPKNNKKETYKFICLDKNKKKMPEQTFLFYARVEDDTVLDGMNEAQLKEYNENQYKKLYDSAYKFNITDLNELDFSN